MPCQLRKEKGSAAVELAIILPVLMMLFAMIAPFVKFGFDYMVVQRAASHGVRYASRADVNGRTAADSATAVRRPSPTEVANFVRDSSNGKVTPASVTVTPNPRQAVPGEPITVAVVYQMSYGPLTQIINSLKTAFFGGGAFLPSSTTVTVSARGREE
ncbi:hypothetical protein BH23ACT12_BH23ACT12_05550 [soil metagenome]